MIDPLDAVKKYVTDVVSGEIVACKSIIGACQRHLDDLDRVGDPDFPYYFDEEHASRVCKFFPVLVRHSIGKHAGKPFELQSWQAFAMSSIFGWKRTTDLVDESGEVQIPKGARRYTKAYLSVARKNGKAEPLDSVLVTPDGTTTMGEVQPGDYLVGMNGEPVKVQAVSEIWKDRPIYEVEFSDGEIVECDGNHEWTYLKKRRKGGRSEKKQVYFTEEVIETHELASQPLADGTGAKFRIPSTVFQGSHRELPIDPYTLGAWLGDGDSSGQYIIGHKDDIGEVRARISGFDTNLLSCKGRPNVNRISMLGWCRVARQVGVFGNKHIPEAYFTASVEQRVELLRGLMDTDGTVSKAGQCEFTQKEGQLGHDVKRLLASLGIYSTLFTKDMKLNGRVVGKKHRLFFFPPGWLNPFHLKRKRDRVRSRKKDGTRKIVRVEQVRTGETKCVQVEGGHYMTGNYVLTHNSTWAAAICHLVAAFDVNPVTKKPESIAQVVIAASKKEQAEKVTMAECVRMRGQSPVMLEKSKYQNRQITYAHNQGSICAIGSDRPFDGLNPSMVVVDELHAFRGEGKQVEFLDTMKTGSGARVQPLFLITTTAGSTSSLLWLQEYGYATRVARSEIKDDTYFSLSYELDEEDDALDPDNWIKANPCLGVTLTKKFLEDQARPAAESDDALRTFTRYHGNRVVSSTSGAFNMDHWKEAVGDIVHETWRLEADCIGCGVDLGGRNDLAAWGAVARFTTGDQDDEGNPVYRYEGFARAYISDKAPRDLKAEPFPEFVESGHLRVCKNPIAELERDLLEFAKRVGAEEVAFDPYQAQRTSEFFADHGMTPVSMPQTTMHFNAPIEEIRACLAENRLIHESSDLLQWCVGNAVVDEDRQQRLMLCKRESSEKIDPAVAFTMAFSRAMNGQSKAGDFLVW